MNTLARSCIWIIPHIHLYPLEDLSARIGACNLLNHIHKYIQSKSCPAWIVEYQTIPQSIECQPCRLLNRLHLWYPSVLGSLNTFWEFCPVRFRDLYFYKRVILDNWLTFKQRRFLIVWTLWRLLLCLWHVLEGAIDCLWLFCIGSTQILHFHDVTLWATRLCVNSSSIKVSIIQVLDAIIKVILLIILHILKEMGIWMLGAVVGTKIRLRSLHRPIELLWSLIYRNKACFRLGGHSWSYMTWLSWRWSSGSRLESLLLCLLPHRFCILYFVHIISWHRICSENLILVVVINRYSCIIARV